VDDGIRAFQELPEHQLLVIYGKHDSQKDEFATLAGVDLQGSEDNFCIPSSLYPNIFFLKLRDNSTLPEYIGNAIASICISENEDFGMVAIESMACGTPVIAAEEGGYLETVRAGETGKFVRTDGGKDKIPSRLRELIAKTPTAEWKNMSGVCREQAEKFSLEHFAKKLQALVK